MLGAMALTAISLSFIAGYEHGTHAGYEAASMAAEQASGYRRDERPGSRASGLGTGP